MSNYIPSPQLTNAVKVAYNMSKPLLLTGEPGCGKTQCATWIKKNLYEKDFQHLLPFYAKTTSSARDLFYKYDAIRHFRAAQKSVAPKQRDRVNVLDYIQFTALGRAILASSSNQRCVVLIDEIDKAPRDFPNDLLNEIENFEFRIEEATLAEIRSYNKWGEKLELKELKIQKPVFDEDGVFKCVDKTKRPFILLTSNSEKNLPDAFMRRCAYFHMEFPTEKETLFAIIDGREGKPLSPNIRDKLVANFIDIRALALRKKPGIAEMLDWLNYLAFLDDYSKQGIQQASALLSKNKEDETLLKNFIDTVLQ